MNKYLSMAAVLAAVVLSACGGSSSSSSSAFTLSATTASYKIDYIADAQPAMGKSAFTLKITKAGAAAPGLAVTLAPVMDMSGGMRSSAMTMGSSHGAPAEDVHDNGDGTYSCAIYYLMAGKWTLGVTAGGEMASMTLDVAAAGKDTPMVKLLSQTQMIMGSTGAMEPMPYYIFNEGMSGTDKFNVFVAARQDMFTYPHISGATVEITDSSTWAVMTDLGGGHYSVSGLTQMKSGTQGMLYIRLKVNGALCTTNGGANTDTNDHQMFMVTP